MQLEDRHHNNILHDLNICFTLSEIIFIIIVMSVIVFTEITFTDDDVTLKVNSVTVGELEHGEEPRLGGAGDAVVAGEVR